MKTASNSSNNRWQFWIDVGGTFTDCLARDPDGNESFLKLLSNGVTKARGHLLSNGAFKIEENPFSNLPDQFFTGASCRLNSKGSKEFITTVTEFSSDLSALRLKQASGNLGQEFQIEIDPLVPAPILAAHWLTRTPLGSSLPASDMFLGTTKGTNALLTRSGAKTALVTSTGFKDLLEIGDQSRPALFDLTVCKPETLYDCSIEIGERILFDGTVEKAPEFEEVEFKLRQLRKQGIESVAVCLMHAYRFPDHERMVGQIAQQIGFEDVCLSSDVAPLIKIVPRAQTTVLDAYLNPVIGRYLNQIQKELGAEGDVKLMTSGGNLASMDQFSGKDSVLSGPAAGVVGFTRVAEQIGFSRSIGFDMGGTSTDVSRYDGEFELEYETQKAGVTIMSPVIAIETVAAGGGSICGFDGTRLTVGPQSAGSDPGPACYGRGGPLTITDVNCFLGRIDPAKFAFELDSAAAKKRLTELQRQIEASGLQMSLSEIAAGMLRIANNNMALAIGNVSVKKGYDARDYPLVSFGGAAGQHCCAVADELGIEAVLIHPHCSILSAFGVKLSDHSAAKTTSVLQPLESPSFVELRANHSQCVSELTEILGCETEDRLSTLTIELRYEGTQSCISVQVLEDSDVEPLKHQFEQRHQQQFGYTLEDRKIEMVAARTTVTIPGNRLQGIEKLAERIRIQSQQSETVNSGHEELQYSYFDWSNLSAGDWIVGPAIIASSTTTVLVDPGWQAIVEHNKLLHLTKHQQTSLKSESDEDYSIVDPVKLEIFNRSFQSIATQMGDALRKTSISVNVKERLDYSCAVFCDAGRLVANAPHIPVHLGAMSEAVQSTIRLNPNINDGDVFVSNDPYAGGSHLPDVTVITPVFVNTETPSFWVASRSHHAEIGGMTPGSMPTDATCLEQEGVLIQNLKLIDSGQENFDALRSLLIDSKYPSRSPAENLDDVRAQVAANQAGVAAILSLRERFGWDQLDAYMHHVRSAAESKASQAITRLSGGIKTFADTMDDGTKICVAVSKNEDRLKIDFAGTSESHSGNLNANHSIVRSAVMYVLRCLVAEDIPLNDGLLNPVEIELPRCFLNPQAGSSPATTPAVVGGNVETSQRIVDVLLGALELAAASQGTMNNWLIGDETFGYYETVGGGSGATAAGPGADAVHCHMSNTRLTDPEILEARLPVVLREFSIRQNSGGSGIMNGGNGMIRKIEFRVPLTLSLLTSRRTTEPFGLGGGSMGCAGENWLQRADGTRENLPSSCHRQVAFGDVLEILTPGGGGFGA